MAAAPVHDAALAAALRRLRHERGLTQEETAHEAGVSMGTYVRIELGQRMPSWGTVRKIAVALDVSLPELGEAIEAEER